MNKPSGAPATVRVTRRGDAVTVDPWRLHVERNQEVEWILEGSDDELTVTPKSDDRPWPFAGGTPRGGRNRPARSGSMRDDAAEGTYKYNVELNSPAGPLLIDPEMILPRPR